MPAKTPSLTPGFSESGGSATSFGRFFLALHNYDSSLLTEEEKKARIRRVVAVVVANQDYQPDAAADNKSRRFIGRLFRAWAEIYETWQLLVDTEKYLSSFPYRSAELSRVRYLRYHIGSYLNLVYILQSRIHDFLKLVERMYKQDHRADSIRRECVACREIASKFFVDIVKMRGAHVHLHQYFDRDLNRLEGWEAFSTFAGGKEAALTNLKYDFQDVKQSWKLKVAQQNKDISDVILKLFDCAYPIVVDQQGNLLLPSKI